MFEQYLDTPACVYALADSLDAILATCEDLQNTTSMPKLIKSSHLDRAVLPLVLQARRYIRELDPLQCGLVHGCANFLLATSEVAINRPSSDPALPVIYLPVSDDHLIAGDVPLGVLSELAGNLLGLLEAQYALYDDDQLMESESLTGGIAPVGASHAP